MDARITLIDNEYACLWFYPELQIIHHKFLQPVSSEIFRAVLMSGLDLMEKHGAQKWLSDDRNNSILSAEDSAWSQEYWLPLAATKGWQYWAVLSPEKSRGRINMKRLMKFVEMQHAISIELFSEPDNGLQWLAQQGAGVVE